MSGIVQIIAAAALAAAPAAPARFSVGIEMPAQVPVTSAVARALADIGIDYVNFYVKPWAGEADDQALATTEGMLEYVDDAKLDFALSCFGIDPPDVCVAEAAERGHRFKGVVFDELAHCRMLNYTEGAHKLAEFEAFQTLDQAYAETLAGYRALYDKFAGQGEAVTATHAWPVLHHVAARAGFDPCPKICKEFYSPVSLAIAMGAALQYGRNLTVDCDMWYYDLVPGHTAEEVKSNLMLAYWLGADRVYLEGAGFNLYPSGRQGIPFSLMNQITPEVYQLTEHGEMLRWFIREYLPEHPRPYTFRDLTPDIAVIRFPDSDYGQRYVNDASWGWHPGLYGCSSLRNTPDTEAWFGLWNLLTCGRTGADGLSHFKKYVAAAGYQRPVEKNVAYSLHTRPVQADSHRFFVPLRGAVVFDHLVDYERLRDVPLLFLTGVQVSAATMEAVRRRVNEGATAVVWGNLARKCGFPDYVRGVKVVPEGEGRFILTDDFSLNTVWQEVWPHMTRPDEINYHFGVHAVTLKRITDNEVAVQLRKP